ncbi:AimR family lysis-lysogeny pheromone receptor [Neobacillus mesonae]|nr:AimR family lysis-lysogeny pheromone receptor [Neobacillus mesonae]
MLENYLDSLDTKITWKQLAISIGIDPSAFSHLKKGTEIGFPYLLKISQLLAGDKFDTILRDWCLKLHKPQNIKYALEYLSINGFTKELELILNKIPDSHRELSDWCQGYRILLSYLNKDDVTTVLSQLKNYNPKHLQTKVLADILEIYCKNLNREYHSMCSLAESLYPIIENIEDEYIRKCYKIRLKENLVDVYLYYYNNPVKAREFAKEVISTNLGAKFTAHSYYIVGMSFLFEDYDKCYKNIMEYRKICMRLGRQDLADIIDNQDIPFMRSVWCKHVESPKTKDISEIAHYEAICGDKAKAIDIIEKAIDEQGVSGYKLYYKGLATGDKSIFMQSMVHFVTKSGNKFAAQLPYEHLKNDATFKDIARMLLDA